MIDKQISDVLKKAEKLHFVGVGGISMSSIAVFAKHRGYEVSGSDRAESEMTTVSYTHLTLPTKA